MVPAVTIESILREARARFEQAGIEGAPQDARALVGGILGLSGTDMIAGGSRRLSEAEAGAVRAAIERRAGGEPVHRILGFRSFYGLDFRLSPATLEPRPDTEILVDTTLELVKGETRALRILDLGTGTGAICLSLLHELPGSIGVGVDISADAVETATMNAEALGLANRFQALVSNWFQTVEGKFDLIVSNPPYIEAAEIAALSPEVRDHDPLAALDGGPDGMDPYRIIAAQAVNYLTENGLIIVEIGWLQREAVTSIFQSRGYELLRATKDFGGNDRVLAFKR